MWSVTPETGDVISDTWTRDVISDTWNMIKRTLLPTVTKYSMFRYDLGFDRIHNLEIFDASGEI